METNYITLTKENIANEHICCAFSDKKCKDSYETVSGCQVNIKVADMVRHYCSLPLMMQNCRGKMGLSQWWALLNFIL